LGPFAAFAALAFFHVSSSPPLAPPLPAPPPPAPHPPFTRAMAAMWNYMGWDSASTIAREVHRPERTYPLAMMLTVGLVALTYLVPVAASAAAGIDPAGWSTGSWVEAGGVVGGRMLEMAIIAGGIVCGVGMYSAL